MTGVTESSVFLDGRDALAIPSHGARRADGKFELPELDPGVLLTPPSLVLLSRRTP